MSVAIIDYGSGNLRSAAKAFERSAREAGVREDIVVTSDPAALAHASHLVLPGVGAFADQGLPVMEAPSEFSREGFIRDERGIRMAPDAED